MSDVRLMILSLLINELPNGIKRNRPSSGRTRGEVQSINP